MVESLLTTLLSIIGFTKYTTGTLDHKQIHLETLQKEVISILATRNCGHADIVQDVPSDDFAGSETHHTVVEIYQILDKVADFDKGGHFQEGTYKLNKTGWTQYDPIYSLHRSKAGNFYT